MPPSKSFTVIPDSAVDTDSPITVTLMTEFRDNDIHLEEWVGRDYVAEVNHDHDGVNSKALDGVLRAEQVFLTTGTTFYTRTAGTTKVRMMGTGGGGGGAADTALGGSGAATVWEEADTQDIDFALGDVNTTNDTITLTGTERVNDDKVRLIGSDLPDPLAEATDYWIVQKSGDDIKLSLTKGGAAINLNDQGSGAMALTLIGFDVVVGAGGTGAASAPAGNGATTSLGSYCSAGGGQYGTTPGAPTGGDYGVTGQAAILNDRGAGGSWWGGRRTTQHQVTYGVGGDISTNDDGAQGIAIIEEYA
jgi:hypothetical protein